ncbi:12653_t:CDS:1, partial [Funneliformis geosporum]
LRQFKKQGKAASASSAESIANDCAALQQLFINYEFEDMRNADETGFFKRWNLHELWHISKFLVIRKKKLVLQFFVLQCCRNRKNEAYLY